MLMVAVAPETGAEFVTVTFTTPAASAYTTVAVAEVGLTEPDAVFAQVTVAT